MSRDLEYYRFKSSVVSLVDLYTLGLDEPLTLILKQLFIYSKIEIDIRKPCHKVFDITDQMMFNVGNSFKYIYRAGNKPDTPAIKDYNKALDYLEREYELNVSPLIEMCVGILKLYIEQYESDLSKQ